MGVRLMLQNGVEIRGRLISQDSNCVVVNPKSGGESRISRASIRWLEFDESLALDSRFERLDPNYSRLIVMATGKPLHKGAGFASDTWLFFPSVSFGITNNVTMMAGMSIFPFVPLRDQLYFLSPKVGAQFSRKLALSVGTLYIQVPMEILDVALGVAYVVGTYGGLDANVTAGLGWGYVKEKDEKFRIGKTPVTLLGGYLRTSEISALLFETWAYPSEEFDFRDLPIFFGVRLFGSRLAIDAAGMITVSLLEERTVTPWLTAAYNFGSLR